MPSPPAARPRRPENVFFGIAVLAAMCWIVDRTLVEPARSEAVQRAQDQYLRTKQGGNAADLCAQAGQVKEAYKRADDSDGSANWTSVQGSDCEAVGHSQR